MVSETDFKKGTTEDTIVTDVSSKYLIREKPCSILYLVLNDLTLTRVPS